MMKQTLLPNGVRVMTATFPGHLAYVTFYVKVGSIHDGEKPGLSHVLEHMAFKGTKSRPGEDINRSVEINGAHMNAETGLDHTKYYILGLPEHLDTYIEILSDIVTDPLYESHALETEKTIICHELAGINDDITSKAGMEMLRLAYGDGPGGRPIGGDADTVRAVTADDLRAHLDRYYHAANIVVCVSGPIDHDVVVDKIARIFKPAPPRPPEGLSAAVYQGGRVKLHQEHLGQCQVNIAFPAKPTWEEGVALNHLGVILSGGTSSPMFRKLRDEQGLCYHASSHYEKVTLGNGLFIISGDTASDTVRQFSDSAMAELYRATDGDIDDHDMVRSLNQAKVGLASVFDNPAMFAELAAGSLHRTGSVKTYDDYISLIEKFDKDHVALAAQKLLGETPTMVLAGNVPEDY